jgi:hypothetical protein
MPFLTRGLLTQPGSNKNDPRIHTNWLRVLSWIELFLKAIYLLANFSAMFPMTGSLK